MINPYRDFPDTQFWSRSILNRKSSHIVYDAGKKFTFTNDDWFATAGSCFAQHFARALAARGGNVVATERAHPLHCRKEAETYQLFPARYGNIYTNRQLLDLLQQATGKRAVIEEFVHCKDGRFRDALRPRASAFGFSSQEEARADRLFHLRCVLKMIRKMNVFVFTMGLTEVWINSRYDYVYPVCPGTVVGEFDSKLHQFNNYSVSECVSDLTNALNIILEINPKARILLTVSPVSLVATAECRSVLVSSVSSKSILRASADEVVRNHAAVDYFPSYEIITGAPTRGRYWQPDGREVTKEGVAFVMDAFFSSRLSGLVVGALTIVVSVSKIAPKHNFTS